jgi:hypothetical protein
MPHRGVLVYVIVVLIKMLSGMNECSLLQSEALERAAGAIDPSLLSECASSPQSVLQQVRIRIHGHSTHKNEGQVVQCAVGDGGA